jgi:hypothetical protein
VCPQYPQLSLDLVFPRHFAGFLLRENIIATLIVCLLSSRCVSRGEVDAKNGQVLFYKDAKGHRELLVKYSFAELANMTNEIQHRLYSG